MPLNWTIVLYLRERVWRKQKNVWFTLKREKIRNRGTNLLEEMGGDRTAHRK